MKHDLEKFDPRFSGTTPHIQPGPFWKWRAESSQRKSYWAYDTKLFNVIADDRKRLGIVRRKWTASYKSYVKEMQEHAQLVLSGNWG